MTPACVNIKKNVGHIHNGGAPGEVLRNQREKEFVRGPDPRGQAEKETFPV
nr:MAG TPA: hypothetical protein [Caudoviricetes sp.]